MSKSSGGTRIISSNNAAQSRTQSSLSGKVSTMDEANKVMDTYKNLYNMPAKEQKAFTDSFGQAVMDTFNEKKKGYDDLMLQRTNKAFKENNKADYDWAVHQHTIQVDNLVQEQQLITEKYGKFIKVKK
jgi:hypothetical protein